MARHARPNPAAPGAADGQNALDELEALAHVGSWSWDIPTDRVTWSHELHRIFGTQENEMPPTYAAYLAAVHPEDRDRVDRIVRGAFQDGKPFTMDHRILRPDGGIRLVECSGRLQAGPDGRP
ncbi:MAG TPA: PAS domain-containing protein, partial [Candidatus Thermoplasmatota archaeon]|nr:PAS domain-containing protein [Candidatus Thermoplasmatota archaeon]